jgi:hypothetical protein
MNRKFSILLPLLAFALAALAGWWSSQARGPAGGGAGEPAVRTRERTPLSATDQQAATLRTLERKLRFGPLPARAHFDAEGMEQAIAASEIRSFGAFSPVTESDFDFEYSFRWARADPVAMFAWLSAEGSSTTWRHSSILFESWAESDLPAAHAAAITLRKPELRRGAIFAVVEAMIGRESARAKAVFVENLDAFSANFEESWFIADSEVEQKVLEMLLSLSPSAERSRLIADLLENATLIHGGAIGYARSVWDQAPQNFREDLVAAGFATSAQHAEAFAGLAEIARQRAELVGTQRDKAAFIGRYGPAWAQRDLPGAMAWTASHLNGIERFDQSAELLGAAAQDDFTAALEAWRSLPDGYLKHIAALKIANAAPEGADPEALRELDR